MNITKESEELELLLKKVNLKKEVKQLPVKPIIQSVSKNEI